MATFGGCGKWYYKDDLRNWNQYNPSSNTLLENAFLSGLKKINLAPHDARMHYTIDLVTFKQRNNNYGTTRDVTRDETGTMPFQSAVMPLSLPVSVPRISSIDSQANVPFGSTPISTNGTNLPLKSAVFIQIDTKPDVYSHPVDTKPDIFSHPIDTKPDVYSHPIDTKPDIYSVPVGTIPAKYSTMYQIGTIPAKSPHLTETIPAKSDTPYQTGTIPSKSGTMYQTETIPAKSGTPYQTETGSLAQSVKPFSYGGRETSAPQTGTITSSVPVGVTPVPKPRSKKRGKSLPKKPTKYDAFFTKFTEIKEKGIPKDETCPICLTPLLEPADVDVPKASVSFSLPKEEVLALKKCSHMFHTICIGTMLDSGSNYKFDDFSISCPICQTIHGVKTGDQPRNGTMTVNRDHFSVPGYEGFGTIVIKYNFSDGVTGTGTRTTYYGAGFPRICYIPDCPDGNIVLGLLRVAWERRLIFTIGTSVTTGRENCVVWNNIHHKTEPHSNSSGHGFPDTNFLKNIKMELAVQGVTEEDL